MPTRRYFLDWLRVLAFGGLILFHVGLMYSGWDYNLKSPVTYPAVEWLLEALSPWRMALLFVISGVACRFLIGKLGPGRFALDRLARLGPVILTGMLLVNPLQVWVQLLAQGDTAKGYLDFWLTSYLASDRSLIAPLGRPMPTWDHLWFLVYLLPYTLLLAAAAAMFRRRAAPVPPLALLLAAPGIWMAATDVLIGTVAPVTHALYNDGGAHLKWLGLFAAGALLAFRDDAWAVVRARRRTLLAAALALLALYLTARAAVLAQPDDLGRTILYRALQGAYGWTAVLAVAGYAARWLDRPSAALGYLNEAVLPVYVLHQPAMLAVAYLVFPLRLPLALEVVLLLGAAGLLPLATYHLAIRPWPPVRRMFGLKPQGARGGADSG
ncbi:acyltransferase family protein [Phenylobacterium sp.]|uniref:acyltransferase family protein n=1 Tax=Phenylobacterium sp. TaxID=1871053 RepID=UPI002C0B75E9|nr:acyltransferase family protein [Phenylobacterium sp.]HVI33368.1 acyltransferase family protein [Phenylobacterium sp.]